jgi:hypothetical protein
LAVGKLIIAQKSNSLVAGLMPILTNPVGRYFEKRMAGFKSAASVVTYSNMLRSQSQPDEH